MKVQPARSKLRPAESGFTLVEIMVVIVILGLLATMVATNVIGVGDTAKEKTAQANIATIAGAVKMYRVKNGKLPDSLEILAEKDEKGRSELEELPKDPWGNDYALREGDRPGEWEVISWGPDGTEGTEDDLSSRLKKEE